MCVHFPSHAKKQVSAALTPPWAEYGPSLLEQLPNEILAKIAERLPAGTQNDCWLALRAMQNLVQSSKRMHRVFNTPYITRIFLRALAKQHEKTPEECAALLHTLGGYCFLQRYIRENGLNKAYAITEELRKLTFQVFEQAKKILNSEDTSRFRSQNSASQIYSDRYISRFQTEKGFFMYVDQISLRVAHPFGVITIHNWDCYSSECSTWIFSIAETLLHHLEGTFRGIASIYDDELNFSQHLRSYRETLYRVLPSECPQKMRKIRLASMLKLDPHSLEGLVGSQALIVDMGGPIVGGYDLRRISGQTLPKPELKMPTTKSDTLLMTIIFILSKEQSKGASTLL